MTIAMIKSLLDACYQAKRIRDLLPPLPKGVAPAYIHYLDVIDQLERRACASGSPTSETRSTSRARA